MRDPSQIDAGLRTSFSVTLACLWFKAFFWKCRAFTEM